MPESDLTPHPLEYLDAFAAWAHAAAGTPGVEIVEEPEPQENPPHGDNSETADDSETAGADEPGDADVLPGDRRMAIRSTSQLRNVWAPHCQGPWALVDLCGEGRVNVRASIIDAVRALNTALVASRYLTRRADTGAYNCRKITSGTGYSLHAYGIAVDINWTTNPYGKKLVTDMPIGMVEAIERIRSRSGAQVWRWGGRYSGNKDAMHFEVVCTPSELASGIDPATVAGQGSPKQDSPKSATSSVVDWDAVAKWVAAVRAHAGKLLPSIQASPNLDGSTPKSPDTTHWQQALNLVSGAGLAEDGLYGDNTVRAVLNFQQFLRITGDFPGAAHEYTRLMMCVALENLSAAK